MPRISSTEIELESQWMKSFRKSPTPSGIVTYEFESESYSLSTFCLLSDEAPEVVGDVLYAPSNVDHCRGLCPRIVFF
jgi:hypothetical protein